jgi:hypothetical protein
MTPVKQLTQSSCTKPNTDGTKQSGNKTILAFIGWTERDSVMWQIINAIYEEYCQARLDEMLKLDAVK